MNRHKDLSRQQFAARQRSRRTGLGVVVGLCFVLATALLLLDRDEEETTEPLALKGDLIDSPLNNTNALSTNAPRRARRQRYKPGSLPQRLVQSRYRLLKSGQTNLLDPTLAPTNLSPDVLLRTNDAVLSTSLVPDAEGYMYVGFDLLSGFDFELTPDIAAATKNAALVSEKIRDQIPDTVRKLNLSKVRLRGFLVPVLMDEGRATEFLLMRDQTLCCYGTVPTVNQWVHVRVQAPTRGVEPSMDIPITVTGTLRVGDQWEKGYFTGIYLLHADGCEFVD
jgi:hypothetical protein